MKLEKIRFIYYYLNCKTTFNKLSIFEIINTFYGTPTIGLDEDMFIITEFLTK